MIQSDPRLQLKSTDNSIYVAQIHDHDDGVEECEGDNDDER